MWEWPWVNAAVCDEMNLMETPPGTLIQHHRISLARFPPPVFISSRSCSRLGATEECKRAGAVFVIPAI